MDRVGENPRGPNVLYVKSLDPKGKEKPPLKETIKNT